MKKDEIKKVYLEFHVPIHVIAHMKAVADVAMLIADKFIKKGIKVNKNLLEKAALLHDALRVCDFREFSPEKFPQEISEKDIEIWQKLRQKYGKVGHAAAAASIFLSRGEADIARLIEAHDFKEIDNLKNWEEKILYYADKRVNGDKVMSLSDRLKKGYERNKRDGDSDLKRDAIVTKIYQLEEEIKSKLGGEMPI